MSKNPRVEEALLKFFYGECSAKEFEELNEELGDSDECRSYLEQVSELLHFLKSADAGVKDKSLDWDQLKSKFDGVLDALETEDSAKK